MSTTETATTAEKPPAKKAAKPKAQAKKPKAKTPKKSKAKPKTKPRKKAKDEDSEDRKRGKALGLGLIHYRVLKSLRRTGGSGGLSAMTYRDIEAATGYYSMLAEVMHTDLENSLHAKKLVRIEQHPDANGRDHVAFSILAKGKKLLEKKAPSSK